MVRLPLVLSLLSLALSCSWALRAMPIGRQLNDGPTAARRTRSRGSTVLRLIAEQSGNQTAGPTSGPSALGMASASDSQGNGDNSPSNNNILVDVFTKNFLFRIFSDTYSFFWNLPRKNMVYDIPWTLFKNNSAQFIAWYQFPHNLPPYRYLQDYEYPEDFFCYGLPGATLPLGQWDPAGLHLVHETVVRKYRESELKHGRLAMLGTTGMMAQEFSHPLHPDIGGLAITHMEQLRHKMEGSFSALLRHLTADTTHDGDLGGGDTDMLALLAYPSVLLLLVTCEALAFRRNCYVPGSDEYRHQFSHNIGIANLKHGHDCGNYGFDPLNLLPTDKARRREMQEKELNHGRLAMFAFVGMLAQEYLLGLPLRTGVALNLDVAPQAEAGRGLAELVDSLARFIADRLGGMQPL